MNKEHAYEEKMDAQLREWQAELDRLQARADKMEADAKVEYYKNIEDLRKKYMTAQQRLEDLKRAGGEAVDELKNGVETAFGDMKQAVAHALSHFA